MANIDNLLCKQRYSHFEQTNLMPDQLYCLSYTDVVDIVFQRQEGCKYKINLVID